MGARKSKVHDISYYITIMVMVHLNEYLVRHEASQNAIWQRFSSSIE
jgi:hypothetical protein